MQIKNTFLATILLGTCFVPHAFGQSDDDPISTKASQLEAQLGQLKDGSPEGAKVMLELVDLYHQSGRALGLVRAGQKFVTAQGAHPKHSEVMLKLIDGLVVTSRNKEIIATSRQFLTRYPQDKQCGAIELIVARTLDQEGDRKGAAEAYADVWKRQPNTLEGREAGTRGVELFQGLNNKEGFSAAATLAESMLDKTQGEFASHIGWQAVYWWHRAGEWAKSNQAANKYLKKAPPKDPEWLAQVHQHRASNYAQLNQRTNAVDCWKDARKANDNEARHRSLINELHAAQAKPGDMEAVVQEYIQKYPTNRERFNMKALLAHAYFRANDKPKATSILAELLPDEARSYDNAATYLREIGTDEPKWREAEKKLQEALGKNPNQAYYIRWVLGVDLYRDRLKDAAKTKQTLRDLVKQSPSEDWPSREALKWLLYNAADDNEFNAVIKDYLATREANLHLPNHRNNLSVWIDEARRNKDHKDRAAKAQAILAEANKSQAYQDWSDISNNRGNTAEVARERLLKGKLTDDQAMQLYRLHAEGYRHVGSNPQRARAIPVYGAMLKRFPKNYQVAQWYLEVSSDYGPPEVAKEASLSLMTIEPEWNNSDAWRRIFWTADRLKDEKLARDGYAWLQKSQQKFGPDLGNSSYIGDIMEKYNMAAEAKQYWEKCLPLDRNHWESRNCAERIVRRLEGQPRMQAIQELLKHNTNFHGTYSMWLAEEYLNAKDYNNFEKVLAESRTRQDQRPLASWGMEEYPVQRWVDIYRNERKDTPDAEKTRVYVAVSKLRFIRPSATAELALLEQPAPPQETPMQRLMRYQTATMTVGTNYQGWDRLMPFGQAALARKDYLSAATLLTGMLSNIAQVDANRKQAARDLVTQCYSRIGGVGLTIDDKSPIAPLLQSALYLRLGDSRMAWDTYQANQKLFDTHRLDMPVDLLLYVCENHIAAGGDVNHDRAEDILRSWLVKFSEAKEIEDSTKAQFQLLLARNYFRSQRYDVARSEFTTVLNRYAATPEATEAEFGIGEAFMAQKVFDQAEAVFEKLAGSANRDVVIRAEFLRGVLSHRRGDRDQARDIFKAVLERVPNIELANQALFNLAEVYGAEERYMDQLELLRTVGRLGRASKRWHTPGSALSIVVQDSDLGISRGHAKIPVRVTTEPGGDVEIIYLISGGAGKGLFRADLDTRLGQVTPNDKVLQLTGRDTIKCDYPDEFKAEFKNVPLADAEIRIASAGKFEAASGKIVDKEKETLSERLERESREEDDSDKRVSQNRPANQIKPGNVIYLKVHDPDRDLSDQEDEVIVKLTATSGDQVQLKLKETGPHTGQFEGTGQTGELPAGALASDTAIDHSPLMAIDRDPQTFWISEPDGATPKWLSVDMKDLRRVAKAVFTSPNAENNMPIRGTLEGSQDGRFWFRIGGNPEEKPVEPVAGEYGTMTQRVYSGNYPNYTTWKQVADLTKTGKPVETKEVDRLSWTMDPESEDGKKPHAVVWHGKLVQPRAGAARFQVNGMLSALVVDGRLELPLGRTDRMVDVWLEQGTHDFTVFVATTVASQGASVVWARADHNATQLTLAPFRSSDFDLKQPGLKPAAPRTPTVMEATPGKWTFSFQPLELRHVRLMIDEYRGEAVAVSHVELRGEVESEIHIPTQADVLSLATNNVLEIAAGDEIACNYTDEFSPFTSSGNQLLTVKLQATYFDANVSPIAYDFVRQSNGAVANVRKQLIRIDPGERFIVEIVDYDQDRSDAPDEVKLEVSVNDGPKMELTAQETGEYTGIFTKEVDTSDKMAEGKLQVKPGDRVLVSYRDTQNTFPGHSVPRETIVYVNQPTEGRMRIVETRAVRPPEGSQAPPRFVYLPENKEKPVSDVAFEVPLTVEVIDPDAAKDSRSKVRVILTTSGGAKIPVDCVISSAMVDGTANTNGTNLDYALFEGRFVGQVIMQLGGPDSPDVVPLAATMPRGLIGGSPLSDEEGEEAPRSDTLVTRVMNLTGKDTVSAGYTDALRPDGKSQAVQAQAKLISNGTLACTDREYVKDIESLHVGEKVFLMVVDADQDVSDERDSVKVEIATERGDKETVELFETLAHSGVFTGAVALRPNEKPTPGNFKPEDPFIESHFGDKLTVKYTDPTASTESGTLVLTREVPVVIGTDGLVAAFSKVFSDEKIAVETQFHIAESYFELFKSHRKLARKDEERMDLEAGRRVLREVMEDYPDPKYAPRISYLLGQFAQELEQWDEAIQSYQMIVRQFPDHSLAADAQYKLAQCYEESGDFDQALEAYVTLAATYPKNPLIANVMIRISEHFYRGEQFDVAAQVGEKFLDRFESHQWAPRMAFRVGQCYYKAQEYPKAGSAFDRFAKIFPDDALCSDSLFWSGESFRMGKNNAEAFRRYNRCRWDFPSSEAAKYARGRLALPEMLRQFEVEANSVDN